MRRLLLSQPLSVLVALSISLCVALAMCAVPLVAIAGSESALVLGLFQPVLCAYAATVIAQRYQKNQSPTLNGLFSRTLGLAVALWIVPMLVLWIDSLRVR